jgi:hypothetical protein
VRIGVAPPEGTELEGASFSPHDAYVVYVERDVGAETGRVMLVERSVPEEAVTVVEGGIGSVQWAKHW